MLLQEKLTLPTITIGTGEQFRTFNGEATDDGSRAVDLHTDLDIAFDRVVSDDFDREGVSVLASPMISPLRMESLTVHASLWTLCRVAGGRVEPVGFLVGMSAARPQGGCWTLALVLWRRPRGWLYGLLLSESSLTQ